MKLKIISLFIILLLFFLPDNSNEIDCTKFKKLSAKYIECNTKKLKEKTSEKFDLGKEKFKKSGIKDKFKKFKNSKTLSDVIKK